MNKEWEDDWKFYQGMCKPNQVGVIAGVDTVLAGKEHTKYSKVEKQREQQIKSDSYKEKVKEKVTGENFEDESFEKVFEDTSDESIYYQCRKKSRTDTLTLHIDPRKLVAETANTTDRLGLSNRQTSMVLAAVVKAGGEDLSKVPLSKSAVQVQRKKARKLKGTKIIESFEQSDTGYVLHYDTKLVNPKGRDREDRAAVLYSGGTHKEPYLLGIPKFESSSGKDVEAGVVKVLDQYDISLDKCIATCYDTTSSNSGYKNGAHFRIEKRVGHAILELECRKHVQELHVTHANKAVFGATKGPQKTHYKDFKNSWSSLQLDTEKMKVFDRKKYDDNTFLIEKADESLSWAEDHLKKETFPRDDYRELNELIVVFLGGQVSGGFKPKRKGAMHEARFMADAIYILSMELFSNEYIMEPKLASQIHKMAVFVALGHGPNFLKCAVASRAPTNDLDYFYDMQHLVEMDDPDFSRIGAFVSDSIQRHTSYLKAPQVIFALFDETAASDNRQALAAALSKIPKPNQPTTYFKPGKLEDVPLVCSVKECVGSSLCEDDHGNPYPKKTLSSFVSEKSYLLFNLLDITDLTWLESPVAEWEDFPSYIKVRDFIHDLLVVNDGAERGIKLMQELLDRTQDEEDLQYLMQCVSYHRKLIGHTKKDYEKLDKI